MKRARAFWADCDRATVLLAVLFAIYCPKSVRLRRWRGWTGGAL